LAGRTRRKTRMAYRWGEKKKKGKKEKRGHYLKGKGRSRVSRQITRFCQEESGMGRRPKGKRKKGEEKKARKFWEN